MKPFYLQRGSVFAVPGSIYSMESAACVRMAYLELKPDCVAVDLPCAVQLAALHAAARLPDISVLVTSSAYLMVEPCDPRFEALRSANETDSAGVCIGEQILSPDRRPDPYAITRIGLARTYGALKEAIPQGPLERDDLTMARRLKELSLRYDRVLLVTDYLKVEPLLASLERDSFPVEPQSDPDGSVATLTESACRQAMAECGFITRLYEAQRKGGMTAIPDRSRALYRLLRRVITLYAEKTGAQIPLSALRPLMQFSRNYALLHEQLSPSLFHLVEAAKSCIDDTFGYLVWEAATSYPALRNIDNLDPLDLSVEQIWGSSRQMRFRPKVRSVKGDSLASYARRFRKTSAHQNRYKPNPFAICSYPPEDLVIEQFGQALRDRCTLLNRGEESASLPFSSGLEEGLDVRETLRQWHRGQLYVRTAHHPRGPAGAVVVIFDEDTNVPESYPWRTTWHGEHGQESDMAFYATEVSSGVIGPGISRCRYGGFMMTYPPKRLGDVWCDPDYNGAHTKAEVLLMAAIDYSLDRHVVFVAARTCRPPLKRFAAKRGKRILYVPLGQLAPTNLVQIRNFHVLDGHGRRESAGEYI